MEADASSCLQHFRFEDFDLERLSGRIPLLCPIRGCSTPLVDIPYRKAQKPFCPEHGIRLHSGTFVYWNGPERQAQAQLRNFCIRPELASEVALGAATKAESYRLGYEMSEDALSWNVFVGLAESGKLREAASFLTGRTVRAEPDLYLWGLRIDVRGGKRGRFPPLDNIRDLLERDIRKFKTEPDIMLVVEGQLVVCIEAKFGSGNPIAYDSAPTPGAKPTERGALLARYLPKEIRPDTRAAILESEISGTFHSQLFRNIVFASEMAAGSNWHVVNLVSSTQGGVDRRASARYSFANPEESIRRYLHPDVRESFTYRTWENLHGALTQDTPVLAALDRYLRGKSAHYRQAFTLE
jgi:hypothetical protein